MSHPRHCAACGVTTSSYSRNQWLKGVGVSRCTACVASNKPIGHRPPPPPPAKPRPASAGPAPITTARRNNATECTIGSVFAQGAFRYVAKGTYVQGDRKGQPSAVKWFKTGVPFAASFYDDDLKVVAKAMDLISHFNNARVISKRILLNEPQVWTSTDGAGKKYLVEPFIANWEKFNSNSGWQQQGKQGVPWHQVMQALSHYSYHVSGGQFVLCDLQGGVYSDGLVLTDPVVLSRSRGYGVTDLGAEGISTFFSAHTCNSYCRGEWTRPKDQRRYFEPSEGTSMEAPNLVPTRHSRPQLTMTAINEYSSSDDDDGW